MIYFVKLLQVSVGALIAVLYATEDLWHTINITEKRYDTESSLILGFH